MVRPEKKAGAGGAGKILPRNLGRGLLFCSSLRSGDVKVASTHFSDDVIYSLLARDQTLPRSPQSIRRCCSRRCSSSSSPKPGW